MARKPSAAVVESHEVTEAQTPALTKAVDNINEMIGIQAQYNQGRDLVNQMLGQAQMANAFSQFSRTVSASKLEVVKKNKLYQQLGGMRAPNGSELRGTWEEFCGLLGISVDKADLDISNVQAFGEEALEQMQRIGIGYRDLRQYRRLGQDERLALIEAAKAGDKDDLLDLAESLISKHTKEKEALTKVNEELAANAAAADRVLGDKEALVTKLQKELAGKVIDPNEMWSEAMRILMLQAQAHKSTIVELVGALDVIRERVMEQTAEPGVELALETAQSAIGNELNQALTYIEEVVAALRHRFNGTLGALID